MREIKKLLDAADRLGLYPTIRSVSSKADPEVEVDGKRVISFCSNNYLGLATNEKVISASVEATRKYGTSCGGSRMISGNLVLQEELERKIAEFKGEEASILFMTGFMANTGTIPAMMNMPKLFNLPIISQDKNLILSDELNHASIVDACRLAKAERRVFKHRDMNDLERALKKNGKKRKLIVTDGVFSMDGDIAPLKEIAGLASKHNAMVMVDDAHATGVLGKNGRGTIEHCGVEGKIDITLGTCSKAFGGVGGFVAGSKDLIRFLRVRARQYIFSSALPPGTSAGIIEAIEQIRKRPELRERLWKNVELFKEGLKKLGFDTLESETQIIPVLIGDEKKAIRFSERLFEEGVFIPCVRWPAVPEGKARLRCTVMATHNEEQIEKALEVFKKI